MSKLRIVLSHLVVGAIAFGAGFLLSYFGTSIAWSVIGATALACVGAGFAIDSEERRKGAGRA